MVEDFIREAAETGDGFSLDEFCPQNGTFLHKFIRDAQALVATDPSGVVQGVAVCGYSGVCRQQGAVIAAYFVVKATHRRKGVGTSLLDAVTEVCVRAKCDTLLFDVYLNNPGAIDFLKTHGFQVTGSLPECGFVVSSGYTDSLLMCKQIGAPSRQTFVAKM